MSSDACAKSTGAIASGHGGGMTISFASYRCSSMSAIGRLCVSRLSACGAPPGGFSSAHACPVGST